TFQQILNIKGVKPADQPAYFRVLQRMVKQASASTERQNARDAPSAAKDIAAAATGTSNQSTPDLKGAMPSHVAQAISSSAPLASKKARAGEHARLGSTPSAAVFGTGSQSAAANRNNAQMSPTATSGSAGHGAMRAARRMSPDPLGITGNGAQPAAHSVQFSPDSESTGSSDIRISSDAASSPVLASLAANATATRTKINENLRKFMSNMRRN
ncbi:hypothetical protein GGI24_004982, partial [Coemansia furcata]